LRLATFFVAARYLVTVSKGIYLKGIGLEFFWPAALMLLGAAIFFVWVAITKFVKKIG
jgi:ABC-2 type transport system permease protein